VTLRLKEGTTNKKDKKRNQRPQREPEMTMGEGQLHLERTDTSSLGDKKKTPIASKKN